jgi:hypothetical protein
MEHFFIEDRFYGDLDDYINDCFPENGDVDALPDDWSIRVQESKLEPMFQLTKPEVAHVINQYIGDTYEDRFNPDDDGSVDDEITEALEACFDADRFNSIVPSLYYPAGYATITKQDLLDYLND